VRQRIDGSAELSGLYEGYWFSFPLRSSCMRIGTGFSSLWYGHSASLHWSEQIIAQSKFFGYSDDFGIVATNGWSPGRGPSFEAPPGDPISAKNSTFIE
jgi:hypothetical protein